MKTKFFGARRHKKIALDKTDYERDHKLTIADELSPENYKLYELFDESKLPPSRSTKFSHPQISAAEIKYENGIVKISIPGDYPDCYEYLLEREENGIKRVVYRGKRQKVLRIPWKKERPMNIP